MTITSNGFWQAIEEAIDISAYQPQRNKRVVVSRLETRTDPYYVIKEPESKSYLRLSESDYALWWQMNGRKSVKELLYYSLKRYRTLPIGHLTSLIHELRDGRFLQDKPTYVYDQIETALSQRAPESRGRRLLNGFLHTEVAFTGLDDFFTPLYDRVKFLFTPLSQVLLFLLVVAGAGLFFLLFVEEVYSLSGGGGLGVFTLFAANIIVIFIHELAHGLMTKHVGRALDRGGFLIYWGLPAFFVDTRDTWLSPSRARIGVSWAGPYSGLVIGGAVGVILTAVAVTDYSLTQTVWASFVYQIGFIAYLSVFVNLNPLLELDGYFMLMDWLEMPGLRERAFRFWREELWTKIKSNPHPQQFWPTLNPTERIFTFFGGLAFVYSVLALWFALVFWQSRLLPFTERLWAQGFWGQMLILVVTAVLVVPTIYYIALFGWSRIQAALEWLARRQLLARPDVLALLVGLPIIAGIPFFLFILAQLPRSHLFQNIFIWLTHIAVIATIIGIARQLPGSRFQWAIWALSAAPAGLAVAWFVGNPLLSDLSLMAAATSILATGIVAWFTVNPQSLALSDRLLIIAMILLGVLEYGAQVYFLGTDAFFADGRWLSALFIALCVHLGLALLAPLLINFSRSRFALPWGLLTLAILAVPWLQRYPTLHIPVIALWLFAAGLYLLLGALAQFSRTQVEDVEVAAFNERERLVNGFDQFINALFKSYEAVFGGRRLAVIRAQMAALGPIDLDATILETAERARQALLLAVDRLDDLAGTPFTRKAGQAAYDSLSWLEAETLVRHVLANTQWGTLLARGFIRARDRREELIRQAEIFAGFDREGIDELLQILRRWQARKEQVIAQAGAEALYFYLIDTGTVGVFHEGVQMATISSGGYFGIAALAGSGEYEFTYRALTPVVALVVDRDRFDPLLRADTTLAQQVSSGAQERGLLKRMPLFSSLSPQELATIDARLVHRRAAAGEVFVRQGQSRSHLFIVAEGVVEVFRQENGTEQVIGKLGPGEHFGEYALFADTPYHASCRATTDTRLLLLDEPKFDELVAACDRMTHYVEQIGSGRLIATRRRLDPSALIS